MQQLELAKKARKIALAKLSKETNKNFGFLPINAAAYSKQAHEALVNRVNLEDQIKHLG